MNANFLHRLPLLLLACGILSCASCKQHADPSKEAEKPKEHNKDTIKVGHNQEGETVLEVSEAVQKRIGLKLKSLAAVSFSPEVKAYGRVLDPAPLAALASEYATASLAVENSRHELQLANKRRETDLATAQLTAKTSALELERTKTLAKQSNASERALQASELAAQKDRLAAEVTEATSARAVQAAESAMHRDEVAMRATQAKLLTSYGRELIDRKDLPEFVTALAAGQMALVRLDVPAGETIKEPPVGAKLISPADAGAAIPVQLLGPTGSTDAQTQGQGFLVLTKSGGPRLAPGTMVVGAVQLAGEKESGVTVPRAAIVRHDGEAFIYVETKAGEFTKKQIELEHATENGWFIHEGLKAGDKVVVTGAQQLLSEESKEKD